MTYDPERHHRRSIRLRGYDYAQAGAYFVTICSDERRCLFGRVADEEMRLSAVGRIVEEEWLRTGALRTNVDLDAYVVMPNHMHGIVLIVDDAADDAGTARRAPTSERFGQPVAGSLGTIVRAFKSAVTRRANQVRGTPGATVWQSSFYEHVVRNDRQLDHFRRYVAANPSRWSTDALHPDNPSRW